MVVGPGSTRRRLSVSRGLILGFACHEHDQYWNPLLAGIPLLPVMDTPAGTIAWAHRTQCPRPPPPSAAAPSAAASSAAVQASCVCSPPANSSTSICAASPSLTLTTACVVCAMESLVHGARRMHVRRRKAAQQAIVRAVLLQCQRKRSNSGSCVWCGALRCHCGRAGLHELRLADFWTALCHTAAAIYKLPQHSRNVAPEQRMRGVLPVEGRQSEQTTETACLRR